MKRLKYYLLILCAGAFAACTDLDIPPKNIFNEQDIFGNVEGATSYLARLYGVLPMEDSNTASAIRAPCTARCAAPRAKP